MTDRPIPLRAEEIRAILEGRKTQTRRVVKPQPSTVDDAGRWYRMKSGGESLMTSAYPCPYGKPGDYLWVRETWCQGADDGRQVPLRMATLYRADGEHVTLSDGDGFTQTNRDGSEKSPWRPSIHMPRWASRITLRITDIRVKRLQEISRGDAMQEGCPFPNMAAGPNPRDWFRDLWSTLHGPNAWDANPWVWVISFERVKP
jgi:hypothetical protein